MTITNLFVIVNVKQLWTNGSFRILLTFFRISWGVGVLNSAIFNSFHIWVEFGTILEGLWNFRGVWTPPPWYTIAANIAIKYICPQSCRYEGKKCRVCQHGSTWSVILPHSKIFHIHSNYTYITGLIPELHNFQFAYKQYSPWYPSTAFQQVCECHASCGNLNELPCSKPSCEKLLLPCITTNVSYSRNSIS